MSIDKRQVAVLRCLLLALDEDPAPKTERGLVERARQYGASMSQPPTAAELRLAWKAAPRDLIWTDEVPTK